MAAGKLCPQNRCPLFIHKGMQISPSAEWTLRTDPHGTHSHSQMCIEGCTAMQLPLKEKQAGLMTRPTRTAVLFVCVRVCVPLFVSMCVSLSTCGRQGSFSTMTTTRKKFGLSVKSSNHTYTPTLTGKHGQTIKAPRFTNPPQGDEWNSALMMAFEIFFIKHFS